MKILNGKIVVGTALAISLGAFTIPAVASVPPSVPPMNHGDTVIRPLAGFQVAQVARDIDQKTDEVRDGTEGAVNAVDAAHRRHEANEYRHRTIGSKIDSKAHELKSEAKGAGHAVERAHERHEATEQSEGRD
jgi:hypothetical protein